MSEDLPNVGLEAGIEGLNNFTKGSKEITAELNNLAAAEAKVQAASEAQIKASLASSEALSGAAASVQQLTWAEQQVADVFGDVGDVLSETKDELTAFSNELDSEAAAASNSQDAHARLQRSYEMLGRYSPQVVDILQEMEREWLDSGEAIEDFADIVEDTFGAAVDQIEAGATQSATALDKMLSLMSLGALQQVSSTLGRLGDQLIGFAKDTVMTAARIEELDLVLGNMAVQNDLSAEAMRKQVELIRAQGIQADVAYSLVTQFVQANLDLSRASDLARLAQDAAVISMEDSSQALAGILHGILTLQPEVLRYRGIIVDLQSAYSQWSKETGRSVQEMNGAEKQAVALQAVLDQGATITGTYESAMESASKQLRSMPRYIADLKAEMGESLLPVYSDLVFAQKDLLKWMSQLPQEIKATVAVTATLTGGLTKGVSSLVSFGSQAGMLTIAMKELGIVTKAASLSFLGPLGIIAALGVAAVALYTYADAQEKAHREEAASILDASESYEDYLRTLDEAELGSYELSESLYEVAKSGEAAAKGIDTLALSVGNRELQNGLQMLRQEQLLGGFGGDPAAEFATINTEMQKTIEVMSDAALIVAQDQEQMEEFFQSLGFGEDMARRLTVAIGELADAEADLRQVTEWADNAVEPWVERMAEGTSILQDFSDSVTKGAEAFYDATVGTYQLQQGMYQMYQEALRADPAVEALTNQIIKLMEKSEDAGPALAWTFQQLADITNGYEQEIREIEQDGLDDRLTAQRRYRDDVSALDEDHAERRGDILGDIAEAHQDMLDDMAKAEADYQSGILEIAAETAQAYADADAELARDRAKAHQDMLDDLADAEREYAKDVVDAHQDMLDDMADAERKYAEGVEDSTLDLARDLQDMEREHQQRLEEIDREAYEDRADLAEEYGQRLLSINERYAREAEGISRKYSLEPEAPDFDERRESLLQELESVQQNAPVGWKDLGREQQIMAELEALKEEELAALEERKQAELDALAAWLAEEQEVRDQAYQAALEAEQASYAERQAERILDYERRLQDLQINLERERQEAQSTYQETLDDLAANLQEQRAERQRAYGEQLQDLDANHQEELNRIDAQNQEKLARLDAQHAEELARITAAEVERVAQLNQQLADEDGVYEERKARLGRALFDQLQTIETGMADQAQAAKEKSEEATDNIITAWNQINPRLADAILATQRNVVEPGMYNISQAFIGEIGRMQAALAGLGWIAHSPAPWWTEMGKSWIQGLEEGFDVEGVLGDKMQEFDKFKVATEAEFEVASPSKWSRRLGSQVSEGFSDTAVLQPSVETLAVEAFESSIPPIPGRDLALTPMMMGNIPGIEDQELGVTPDLGAVPEVDAQDLALYPYLASMPAIPEQEIAMTPYMPDLAGLNAPNAVQAAVPAEMAAAGVTTRNQTISRTNNLTFHADYTKAQSEASLRQDLERFRMKMRL